MSEIVDLRSDTVTRPTADMRAAIAAAEVGDDVLGDDPTVIRLQARCATLFGQEAALFVPSGTMANALAVRSATEPGDEIICDEHTHSYTYEGGGPAALSGVSVKLLHTPRGIFTPDDVARAVRPDDPHFPRSRLVIAENTNHGAVWSVARIAAIGETARRLNLHLHIDGARLMNACIAAGCQPSDYARHADSVSMCFSKGLGAPVGSILVGSQAFIGRAIRFRKMFGGAMRQSGLLAAAALYALDHHVERLAEDHANATYFAKRIASLPGIQLDPADVETNMVFFGVDPRLGTPEEFEAKLRERGVWMFAELSGRIRAVTHLDVSRGQVDQAIAAFQAICHS